jgi:uncharacterized membrane protein
VTDAFHASLKLTATHALRQRKTFLLCAVSLTTLASVASIVPLTSERRANRSLFETTPQQSAALTTATTEQVRVAAIAPPAETPATASTFAPEAARRNGVLKDELRWTFGGKQATRVGALRAFDPSFDRHGRGRGEQQFRGESGALAKKHGTL